MDQLVKLLKNAQNVVLSTHRECDGDGLGAQLGLYHALKQTAKTVSIINVDPTPRKYDLLEPHLYIQYYEQNPSLPKSVDLTLVFDTNDERLLGELGPPLKRVSKNFLFIDHHPELKEGPKPTPGSYIEVKAASTGELTFDLIKRLELPLNTKSAEALYTSITFDTQMYRYVRGSSRSHEIAAELLKFPISPERVHRALFGHQTVQKIAFLAKALGQIEYFLEGRLAVLRLRDSDLFHYGLEPDESRDVVDFIMSIQSLEAAVLFREDAPQAYKLSLRSKGLIPVLPLAESLGGGGHMFAAGAYVKGSFESMKKKIVQSLEKDLNSTK